MDDLTETVTKMAEKVVQLTETAKLDGLFNGIQGFNECLATASKGPVILDATVAAWQQKINQEWASLKAQGLPPGSTEDGDAAVKSACEQLELLKITLTKITVPPAPTVISNYELDRIHAKLDRILHAQRD